MGHARASVVLACAALLSCDKASEAPKPDDKSSPAPAEGAEAEAAEKGAEPTAEAAVSTDWSKVELEPIDGENYIVKDKRSFGDELTLPLSQAYEAMIVGAPVVLSERGAFVDGDAVALLDKGTIAEADLEGPLITRMLPPLQAWSDKLEKEASARGEVSWGNLVVFADAKVEASSLIRVVYTGGRAKFRQYQLAIDVGVGDLPAGLALTMSPPMFSTDGRELNVPEETLTVAIDSAKVVLWNRHEDAEALVFDHGDQGAVAKLVDIAKQRAATTKSKPDSYPTLVFGPEGDVTMARLVTVLSALAGPACGTKALFDVDRSKCFFPLRVIQASVDRPPEL